MEKWKESLKDQWSEKVFQHAEPQLCAVANAAALAQIEVLNKLIELEAVDLNEALNDE